MRGGIKGGGRVEKGKTSLSLYSKCFYYLWGKNNDWLQQGESKEGRIFKKKHVAYTRGPCRKFLGHQLSCHWFQNFCSPDLLREGMGVGIRVSMREAGLHLSTKPICSETSLSLCGWGLNKSFCATRQGGKGPRPQWAEKWITHKPRGPPTGSRVAAEHRTWELGPGKMFLRLNGSISLGFLLLWVSRYDGTESVVESLSEAMSAPFGDQMFLGRG